MKRVVPPIEVVFEERGRMLLLLLFERENGIAVGLFQLLSELLVEIWEEELFKKKNLKKVEKESISKIQKILNKIKFKN